MKAVLFSNGTRGDMEPFLAIGEILKEKGWDVLCVFPEQFRPTVEQTGFRFTGFSRDFLDLLDSHEAKMVMGGAGSWFDRIRFLVKISKNSMKLQKDIVLIQHNVLMQEQPDLAFYHPKCIHVLPWGMANPGKSIMINPVPCMTHPVKHLTSIGFKGNSNKGLVINSISYWLVNSARAIMTYRLGKKHFSNYGNVRLNIRSIYKWSLKRERTFYTVSSSLFPRPDYWPESANVVGYYERDKSLNWSPNPALIEFLDTHKKIVFISFGSMVNNAPQSKTEAILSVLSKHRIPAIINTSWGGLEKVDKHPEHVIFVENIPYDWILSKVYAVVHHGGSGTTHTALKYGCACMIIPHIIDQYYWNNTIAKLQLGPKGPSIKQLDHNNFERKLLELLGNSDYKFNAKNIALKMEAESNREEFYRIISTNHTGNNSPKTVEIHN